MYRKGGKEGEGEGEGEGERWVHVHAWYSFPLSLQKPFSESLSAPEFVITDFAKFDRPAQLHLAWQALDRFVQSEGRAPRPYNTEDSARFLELATALNDEAEGAGKVRTFHMFLYICNVH